MRGQVTRGLHLTPKCSTDVYNSHLSISVEAYGSRMSHVTPLLGVVPCRELAKGSDPCKSNRSTVTVAAFGSWTDLWGPPWFLSRNVRDCSHNE